MSEKIETLAENEGVTVDQMLRDATFDSVAPGICITEGCDYTTNVEPDCYDGYCENCDTNTVQSCLAIVGII